jgi:kumamolisin
MEKQHVKLPGSARQVRPGAKLLGVAGPDEWIELTIKLRRKKELPVITGRPSTILTRAELEAEYGADPADIQKVSTVLSGLGLKVLSEDPMSCSVKVAGPTHIVEKVFLVKLFHYSHASGNYRGRTGDLHIPAELAGIVTGVFGLDNRKLVKSRPHRRKLSTFTRDQADPSSRSWFFPAELASIYGFPDGNGQGQTIGILEFGGGFFSDDLATFCQDASIPVPTVKAVSVNNTPTNQRDGAEDEVMLDVEVVAGVCPAASIVVYFSTFDENGWISNIDTAVHDTDNPLKVLSISWGYAEDAQGAWSAGAIDAISDTLQAATLLGVTICVAAGDDGSDDGVGDGPAHVDFPASSPYVLSVGGTTLRKLANGGIDETAWKDGDGLRQDNGGSTGGGVSTHFQRPGWQTVTVVSVNPGSIDGRVVPDVAADASGNTGYWMVVDGQGGANGGTSASAPLWAGLIARVNAGLAAGKQVGYLTPLLYQQGADGNPLGTDVCRDITTGDNITAAVGGYTAGPGYDAVTGWGVPEGNNLLTALKALI